MRPRVSVCMATYNAGRFLPLQLDSILSEIGSADEVVVVDDDSTDGTRAWLCEQRDPRIQLHFNPRRMRAPQTFARAMALAQGEFIVLADQDDVWISGRVSELLRALETSGASVVCSNAEFIDAEGVPIEFDMPRLRAGDARRHVRNIARIYGGTIGYQGCAMAFASSFRQLILPIPAYVEAHDLWIALAANLVGSNAHLEATTLRRRIHGANASVIRRPLQRRLWARVKFTVGIGQMLGRILRGGRPSPEAVGAR